MNNKPWIQKALTMCLVTSIMATCSVGAFASSGKTAGELIVNGDGDTSFVTVNGEPSKSGRTVFSSSTIITPDGKGAMVNFGKAGKIAFAPSTTFTLSFDGKTIGGDLSAGSISVINAAQGVSVRTLTGETVTLNAGDTVTAGSANASRQDDDDDDKTNSWVPLALYFAIVGTAVILVLVTRDDDPAPSVSPVR